MKKLVSNSLEERLQKLDKLSINEAENIQGGYSTTYNGVKFDITGKPTNSLPPFKNPTFTVGYTF